MYVNVTLLSISVLLRTTEIKIKILLLLSFMI